MGGHTSKDRRVKTADTIFDIIETLEEKDGATITELSDELDLAASTVHNHLSTLEEKEYVVKDGSTFHVGLKFLYYGMYAKNRRQLMRTAKPVLDELADETDEAALLVVEEHGKAIFLGNSLGDKAIQTYGNIGTRTHLHAIAAGKAILAHLPEDRVQEIIEQHGLPALTEQTMTDRADLLAELEEIREAGFALNRGGRIQGGCAIASALVVDGEVQGAVAVAGPEHRMRGERFTEEFPHEVMGAKNIIELELTSGH